MVEYRKLISFGKSSYVISLPKAWVLKNKLEKGSLIAVTETTENLLLSPKLDLDKRESKKIIINVDNKDFRRIKREIIAAYINNNQTIILTGKELKNKSADLRGILHNIMALEIMEQTSDRVVAKDFLNMKKLQFSSLIRKMDVMLRSMLSDTKICFKEDVYDHIRQREADVDRLAFLIYRMVKFSLMNPSEVRDLHVTPNDLLNYWWMANNLEKATDKIKHLAKHITDIKVGPKIQSQLVEFLTILEGNLSMTMKAYYSNNKELAFKAANEKEPLIKGCVAFVEKNWKIQYLPELLEHIKETAIAIHNIGRTVYS
ncbi:MAG: phosphate uptake regulator PhoU [Nanoarchaeota archaeon]|nr:phosphate uptake regulator PhoU [Nanoarchaeota archaeon]